MHQEHVGNLGQALEGFVVALHQRLPVRVGAGHHEDGGLDLIEPCGAGRVAGGFVEEQIMERRVGQHHADFVEARGDARQGVVKVGQLFEQHDGPLGAFEGGRFGGRHLGPVGHAGHVGKHQRQRLVGTALAHTQAQHRIAIGGVAGQVKTTEALDGDHFAQLQAAQGFGHRVAGQGRHAVGLVEAQLRPAFRAGIRLGMEAPVARVAVFGIAAGALGKGRHAGARPVVGQAAGDGVARAAVGAVDEGVAPAPVLRVEKFGQARRTHAHVRPDGGGDNPLHARQDLEAPARVVGRNHFRLDGIHSCQGRRLAGEALGESIEDRLTALDLDLYPAPVIAHPAHQPEAVGETVDEGPEAHALHHAAHTQAAGHAGRINDHQHGHVTGLWRPGPRPGGRRSSPAIRRNRRR